MNHKKFKSDLTVIVGCFSAVTEAYRFGRLGVEIASALSNVWQAEC